MTLDHQKWRNLCQEAIREHDVNKLLRIYLKLDRMAEREQQHRSLGKPPESTRKPDLEALRNAGSTASVSWET